MQAIKIIGVPNGEAPTWVREAWLGVTIPINSLHPTSYFTKGVVSQKPRPGHEASGYVVPAWLAIDLVELSNPQAAAWWRTNTRYYNPGLDFVFNAASCEIVTITLADLPNSRESGKETIGNLFDRLDQIETPDIERWLTKLQDDIPPGEWSKIQSIPLTRIAVCMVGQHFVDCIRFEIITASLTDDERRFDELHLRGHSLLEFIAHWAQSGGIAVKTEEINLPLSQVDLLLEKRMIEYTEGGTIRFTEAAQKAAKSFLN